MKNVLNIHQTFEKENHTNTQVNNCEFEECIFKNCDFSNSDFSNTTFMNCEFIECNLSMTQLIGTSLKTVVFKNCKLLGIQFQRCTDFLFDVEFQESVLDYSSFTHKKMPKTIFNSCSLKEVSFVGTNLTNSIFNNCNLERTLFNDTQLGGVDFRTAFNYIFDPELNSMKKAKFSAQGLVGLLDKYDIKIE